MNIIDKAILDTPPHWTDVRRIKSILPVAKRFVFDGSASRTLGAFIRDCGDLILANRQFAIPPYEQTYIEFDLEQMLSVLSRRTSGNGFPSITDARIGYLIDGHNVYCSFEGTDLTTMISPFIYHMDVDNPPSYEHIMRHHAKTKEQQEWAVLSLMLGTTMEQISGEKDRASILSRYGVSTRIDPKSLGMSLIQGSAGDMRNIIAALLLINQPSSVEFEKIPARRGFFRGKHRSYAAHSVVTVSLGRKKNLRKAFHFDTRNSPRRHEVRGHFAHIGVKEGCEHNWPLAPDENMHWKCSRCGGVRFWKNAHLRGDATIGFITKEYKVNE